MLSNRIIKLRKGVGLNQMQLAEKLNVTASAIGMYEQGRRTPNVDTLILMAELFDVSLDYLLTGMEFTYSDDGTSKKRIPKVCPCQTCYWKECKDAD